MWELNKLRERIVKDKYIYEILKDEGIDSTAMVGDQCAFEVLEGAILGALEQIEENEP